MKYHPSGQDYIVVLAKDEDLIASLARLVEETGINNAWIQAIGAALEVELGYYDLAKQRYHWQTFSGPLEISSLAGNVVNVDGKPVFHMHGTFANQDYSTVGGHVKKLTVAATCEVFVHRLDTKLSRRQDQAVGLNLLQEDQ